jgi:hypothetical protein
MSTATARQTARQTRAIGVYLLIDAIRRNPCRESRAIIYAAAHRLSSLRRELDRFRRLESRRPLTKEEEHEESYAQQEALELAHSLGRGYDLTIGGPDEPTLVLTLPDGSSNDRDGHGWIVP